MKNARSNGRPVKAGQPKGRRPVLDARLRNRLVRLAESLRAAEEKPFSWEIRGLPESALADLAQRLERVAGGEDARFVFGQASKGRPSTEHENAKRAWV